MFSTPEQASEPRPDPPETSDARTCGILLAGGYGTRLYPLTRAVSKQLLPVYNKPMVYYPLSVLMLAGIREVMVISTPDHLPMFRALLGDGSAWGMAFTYVAQPEPKGLAQAFLLCPEFHADRPTCLVLGDNIIYAAGLRGTLSEASRRAALGGATIFGYPVKHPQRYGVVELDDQHRVVSLEEKPLKPKSHFAVPGLYFYDRHVTELARTLRPSARGELEITDLNRLYLQRGELVVRLWGRGTAWLDAGTHESLLDAQAFVRTIEERQGTMIACPEEIAFHQKWIDAAALDDLGRAIPNEYGRYLRDLAARHRDGPGSPPTANQAGASSP